ncbi:MAG TPA: hypothetical protein VK524_19205, partial [Polyangiaceae bacterium]|nr:hypothetical protein [Polyangiaceae bacterium]
LLDRGPAAHERTRFHALDAIAPGLYLAVVNASIALYNGMYAGTDPAAYRRCDPNNSSLGMPEQHSGHRFCVDATKTPLALNEQGQPHLIGGWAEWTTEQYSAWGVMQAATAGAEPARVKTWSDWVKRVWP